MNKNCDRIEDCSSQDTTPSTSPNLELQSSNNIKVIARFRPLTSFDQDASELELSYSSSTTVSVPLYNDSPSYTLDRVFPPNSPQSELYEFVGKPTIEDIMVGYNGTIFAYGQTGSGKTYTMMGSSISDPEEMGIIPRASSHIFELANHSDEKTEFSMKCSMLEIYKEKLYDLLNTNNSNLKIKQKGKSGVYVEGLGEHYVTCYQELIDIVETGEKARTVAATKLNKCSSRSHQLFILTVKQTLADGTVKMGVLNLVDLAGSENVKESRVTGENFEEAKKINLSLSALGNVIHALTSRAEHIPYRDSKLTRLLSESLGGNFKTTLIVACSANKKYADETVKTLKFATRTKKITNSVSLNIVSSRNYLRIIKQLKEELAKANGKVEFMVNSKEIKRKLNKQKTFSPEGSAKQQISRMNTVDTYSQIDETIPESLVEEKEELLKEVNQLKEENSELAQSNEDLKSKIDEYLEEKLDNEQKCFEKESSKADLSEHGYLELQTSVRSSKEAIRILKRYIKTLETRCSTRLMETSYVQLNEDAKADLFHWNSKGKLLGKEIVLNVPGNSKNTADTGPNVFELKQQVLQGSSINSELTLALESLKTKHSVLKQQFNSGREINEIYKNKINELNSTIRFMHDSYGKTVRLFNKKMSANTHSPVFYKPVQKDAVNATEIPAETVSSNFLLSQTELYRFQIKQLRETISAKSVENAGLRDQMKILATRYKELFEQIQRGSKSEFALYQANSMEELARRETEINRLNETLKSNSEYFENLMTFRNSEESIWRSGFIVSPFNKTEQLNELSSLNSSLNEEEFPVN